jgi:hypothetical protein
MSSNAALVNMLNMRGHTQQACYNLCLYLREHGKTFNSILVVVNRFSKYSHFIPLKHPFSAKNVAQQILDVMVRLHGMLASVVSDRNKIFTTNFWRELFRLSNTKLITSTPYHPQIDRQTERVN